MNDDPPNLRAGGHEQPSTSRAGGHEQPSTSRAGGHEQPPVSRADGHEQSASHQAGQDEANPPANSQDEHITVALIDDQELARTGLRLLLERDPGISVVGEAGNGRSGIRLARRTMPDVALMDIRMPEMDGLEATRQIVGDADLHRTKVIVLTTFDEDEDIYEAIRAGAAGYLLKDISPQELRHAVRVVAGGEALLSPSITRRIMQQLASVAKGSTKPELLADLTEREGDVLRHVGLGESNDEIAQSLSTGPVTARTYVSRLLAKLEARDRSQLVIIAYESGLITPGEF